MSLRNQHGLLRDSSPTKEEFVLSSTNNRDYAGEDEDGEDMDDTLSRDQNQEKLNMIMTSGNTAPNQMTTEGQPFSLNESRINS
jgi:hypothetical protein